jgi:predicted O-methyltransferase YrrM
VDGRGTRRKIVAGRTSLPGVDELFGASAGRPRREPEGDEPRAARPDLDEGSLEAARRAMADEPDPLRAARRRLDGAGDPPSPEVGSLLRWAVLTCGATAVIEVGSAGGISGAWLLSALPEGGVLTSIEPDPSLHERATETYRSFNVASRPRSIQGDPETVLPRLADDSYDLLLLQAEPSDLGGLDHARRLLRDGGWLVVRGVLRGGEHADARERLVAAIAEDDGFVGTVLPIDGGVLLATRRHPTA